jgi:tetratricopeptide (TPR) repeat protein
MTEISSYDPNVIIKAADDKLANNDLEGGQMLFQSALLDWVDDAREKVNTGMGGADTEQMREAIATLWIAYAHYLGKAKQFKSATEAYEQAAQCPVAGNVGRIWLDYARFAEERGKLRTAQQVYLRALVGEGSSVDDSGGAVVDEQDRALLWNEFLEMMRQNNPTLTMKDFRLAIDKEQQQKSNGNASDDGIARESTPEQVGSSLAGAQNSMDALTGPPPAKRPRLESEDIKMEDATYSMDQQPTKTYVVTATQVNEEQLALEELTRNAEQDPGFVAAWMLRDGDAPPQPPEPPLFSAAPPKLADPTAKDILGEDLALELIQRLLQPSGTVLLEVCRALWMLMALKENLSQKALEKLDATVREELDKMNSRLDERLSVAGAAESAVRVMNDTERSSFQMSCNQQRQHVLNGIAWEFRQLLWVQQQLLTKLNVPGFDGTTVDAMAMDFQSRVCAYLHSAFYLRKRIGETIHVNMLKSQAERLKQHIQAGKNATLAMPPAAGVPSKRKGKSGKSRFSPPLAANTGNTMGRYSPVPQQGQQQRFMGQQPQAGYTQGFPPGQQQQQQQQQFIMPGSYSQHQKQQQQPPHQQQNFFQIYD